MTVFLLKIRLYSTLVWMTRLLIKQLGRGCFFCLKPTSKVLFALFLFCLLITISWVFSGKVNIIMIELCQWDVRHPVALSRCLALLSNGLLKDICQIPHLIHILDDFLMTAPTFPQCRITVNRTRWLG